MGAKLSSLSSLLSSTSALAWLYKSIIAPTLNQNSLTEKMIQSGGSNAFTMK
jgi:hypothetical protein